jgi:prepilin-type processing-associated H-X9-DG protein
MTEQMEPERHIEKLLRAYAKKRRAQTGDPLKLHPATRRLLQGEVARHAPQPDEEDASLTLWELFRRRWALLAGFVCVIFFMAALCLPALSKAKFKATSITAMSNLKQIGMAAQMAAGDNHGRLPASLDALTNQLGSSVVLTDTVSGKRFVYVAGGKDLDALPGNSVLAYSPTDKKGRAVLFADGHVENVKAARFAELTNQRPLELAAAKASPRRALAGTPAAVTAEDGSVAAAAPVAEQIKSEANAGELAMNAPDASKKISDRLVTSSGTTADHSIALTNSVQFASGSQNAFRNTATQVKAASVLANFQVQQNGNAIRVVDADGSVYDGVLLADNAVVQNEPAAVVPAAPPVVAPAQQMELAQNPANRNESPAPQNYFFRVTGTNRTLKQNVVFTGNLLPIASAAMNTQQSFADSNAGGGQSQSAVANQRPWSGVRIAGVAVIAGTNNIEINAVLLAP